MPTYEYVCNECKYEFEAFQSIMDDPLTECKKCKGKLRKLISKNGMISFKGDGFYINESNKPQSTDAKNSSSDKDN